MISPILALFETVLARRAISWFLYEHVVKKKKKNTNDNTGKLALFFSPLLTLQIQFQQNLIPALPVRLPMGRGLPQMKEIILN